MSEEDKEVKQLVQSLFERTNTKVGEDDPSIVLLLGLRDILRQNIQDFEENITALNSQQLILIRSELEHAIANIQMQLDGSNEYYVGNSTIHEQNLAQAFKDLLNELDTKNKDLNFILSKIQAEHDKINDDRWQGYFERLDKTYDEYLAEQLEAQATADKGRVRDFTMAGIGFLVGVIVCLAVFFVVR